MATIPSNTFKLWRDGDIVTAEEYMQELEILRTAINANGTDISVLKNAALGFLRGVLNGPSFPPSPTTGDVFLRTDENKYYFLDSAGVWIPLALNADLTAHINNKENPHGITPAQIGTYSKTETDTKFVAKSEGILGGGQRIETVSGLFFTNGGSPNASANITFAKPFTKVPVIIPGNTSNSVPYSDTLHHPYFYNMTTSGFSCRISAAGNLGTLGSPVNLIMNFLAIGN